MKVLLPALHERDQHLMEQGRSHLKSGILVTSSIMAYYNAGPSTIYSASKIFCNFLALAVGKELEAINSRVEVTILNPGFVYSNMTA